jgi:hypothetical protein
MYFDLASCPDGWSATDSPEGWPVAPSAGRAIVGLTTGGTPAGEVGVPLADLESRLHAHGVPAATATTDASPAHGHGMPGFNQATSSASDGSHRWAYALLDRPGGWTGLRDVTWYSYTATGSIRMLQEWDNGIDRTEGDGIYHVGRNFSGDGPSGNWYYYLYTNDSPSHAHDFTTPERALSETGEHGHDVTDSGETGSASTSAVMPYVQLLACRKL